MNHDDLLKWFSTPKESDKKKLVPTTNEMKIRDEGSKVDNGTRSANIVEEERKPKRSITEISGDIARLYAEYDSAWEAEKRRKTEKEDKEWREHKESVREWCEDLLLEMPSMQKKVSF